MKQGLSILFVLMLTVQSITSPVRQQVLQIKQPVVKQFLGLQNTFQFLELTQNPENDEDGQDVIEDNFEIVGGDREEDSDIAAETAAEAVAELAVEDDVTPQQIEETTEQVTEVAVAEAVEELESEGGVDIEESDSISDKNKSAEQASDLLRDLFNAVDNDKANVLNYFTFDAQFLLNGYISDKEALLNVVYSMPVSDSHILDYIGVQFIDDGVLALADGHIDTGKYSKPFSGAYFIRQQDDGSFLISNLIARLEDQYTQVTAFEASADLGDGTLSVDAEEQQVSESIEAAIQYLNLEDSVSAEEFEEILDEVSAEAVADVANGENAVVAVEESFEEAVAELQNQGNAELDVGTVASEQDITQQILANLTEHSANFSASLQQLHLEFFQISRYDLLLDSCFLDFLALTTTFGIIKDLTDLLDRLTTTRQNPSLAQCELTSLMTTFWNSIKPSSHISTSIVPLSTFLSAIFFVKSKGGLLIVYMPIQKRGFNGKNAL